MIEPIYNEVNVGDNTTFTCNSIGEVTWYYSGKNEEPIALHITKKELKLTSVTFKSAGYYFCYGHYPYFKNVDRMENPYGMFLSRSTLEVFCMFVNVIMLQLLSDQL